MTQQDSQDQFLKAVASLAEANAAFAAGTLKSVPHADARGAALSAALLSMAACHGVLLQTPVQIDSNGEFSLVALKAPGANSLYGCGSYGKKLAERLTKHKGRTGAFGPATFYADSGWCRLNHFNAEAMVLEYAAELQAG